MFLPSGWSAYPADTSTIGLSVNRPSLEQPGSDRSDAHCFEDELLASLLRRVATVSPVYSGPANARLYAVGDIHGRLDLLDDLLGRIVEDIETRQCVSARLAFLGDFIDRGPASAGVIDRLSQLSRSPVKTDFLIGNHEEMLLRVLSGEPSVTYDWLEFGGNACAESYGLSPNDLATLEDTQIVALLRQAMPKSHVAFLQNLETSVQFGDFLLVHAGIRPGVALENQRPIDLRWIRHPFLTDPRDHGVMVIHGHTVTNGVDRRLNRIGIDTGAYSTGILTAAVIEETEVRFLETRDR